jgi:hypothetical protein
MKTCVDTNVLGKAQSVAQAKSGGAVVLLADDNTVCRERSFSTSSMRPATPRRALKTVSRR